MEINPSFVSFGGQFEFKQRDATLIETTIPTKNLELAAIEWGNKDQTPVIALHGWLDNAASFIPIASHLNNLRIIAIDMPGHGKSQHRSGVNAYHFIDYATDIILAADSLGLDQFSLLGHSLGAAVSGVIASIVPDRIQRLAMVEGLAPVANSSDKIVDQLRKHVESVSQIRGKPRVFNNVDDAARARQQAGYMSLPSARLLARRNLAEVEGGYSWHTDRCLRLPSPLYLAEDHVSEYLKRIVCEILLIRSDEGIIRNWNSLKGREQYLNNLTVIDVAGGHHCHMDDPELIATHVAPFFR